MTTPPGQESLQKVIKSLGDVIPTEGEMLDKALDRQEQLLERARLAESELTACRELIGTLRNEQREAVATQARFMSERDAAQSELAEAKTDACRMHYLGNLVRSRSDEEQSELNNLMRKYPPRVESLADHVERVTE